MTEACALLKSHDDRVGWCRGRVLNVKAIRADMNAAEISAVLAALLGNFRVEILFMHALDRFDAGHLEALVLVLQQGRIWALNLGETNLDFRAFPGKLRDTNVAYMFIECNFISAAVKDACRAAIRWVRARSPTRDSLGRALATKMWFSPASELGKYVEAADWMQTEVPTETAGTPVRCRTVTLCAQYFSEFCPCVQIAASRGGRKRCT